MRTALHRTLALASLLAAPSALAGERKLQNDGFVDGDAATFQGGFVANECWASVYEPDSTDYPFSMKSIEMLVGGDTSEEIFILEFYSLTGTNMNSATRIGEEAVLIQGSNDYMTLVTIEDLELSMPEIESGNVAVAGCFSEHDGFPAIANDADGSVASNLNWLQADDLGGVWANSNLFGVRGDWVMRLCIEGDSISGTDCYGEG
ncbi:MAG: hypothetical protein CL927_13055, partial [Deltaproteobacteria bacterium]|nr:hypothetical protein [Deltaproteobacteria bacterium]